MLRSARALVRAVSLAGSRLVRFVAEPLAEADRMAIAHMQQRSLLKDRRAVGIVLLAAGALLIQHYILSDDPDNFLMLMWSVGLEDTTRQLYSAFTDPETGRFNKLLLWVMGTTLSYLVLPAILLKLSGARLRDYGLRFPESGDVRIYGVVVMLALPLIVLAVRHPSFFSYYPLYFPPAGEPLWPRFIVFEFLYILQFVAVEFLFRGVLIHGTKHRIGAFSILLPLIPYVMIHFEKPVMEAIGAVFAGLFLGFMSLKSGSIIYGIVLHIVVAVTMDMAALALQGRLF
jgi:CAAX amino terminal protease family.